MEFEIYCIVLGGTDSLLNVLLPKGYEFRKIRANETRIHKKIKNLEGNLLPQYYPSNLTHNTQQPEFICIYKRDEVSEDVRSYKEQVFREIEKIISLLQIYKQKYISLYNVFYSMPNKTDLTTLIDCNGIIVGDKFYVTKEEIVELQNFLCLEDTIYSRLEVVISNYFNSTKFIDCFMQLQYLVTLGELLVLKKDKGKKEAFSKRLALLTEFTEEGRKETYQNLCNIYKLRSDWVHDGKSEGIDLTQVIKLRIIICKAIKAYMVWMRKEMECKPDITFKQLKTKLVKQLKGEVELLGNNFFV